MGREGNVSQPEGLSMNPVPSHSLTTTRRVCSLGEK